VGIVAEVTILTGDHELSLITADATSELGLRMAEDLSFPDPAIRGKHGHTFCA
jgi:hypothetical protein